MGEWIAVEPTDDDFDEAADVVPGVVQRRKQPPDGLYGQGVDAHLLHQRPGHQRALALASR